MLRTQTQQNANIHQAYPSGSRPILILDERKVAHEVSDLRVLRLVVFETTLCLAVPERRDVGILHVITNCIADGVDPFHFASKHFRQLISLSEYGLLKICQINEDM